jgi:hypothetical protein
MPRDSSKEQLLIGGKRFGMAIQMPIKLLGKRLEKISAHTMCQQGS